VRPSFRCLLLGAFFRLRNGLSLKFHGLFIFSLDFTAARAMLPPNDRLPPSRRNLPPLKPNFSDVYLFETVSGAPTSGSRILNFPADDYLELCFLFFSPSLLPISSFNILAAAYTPQQSGVVFFFWCFFGVLSFSRLVLVFRVCYFSLCAC